MTVKLTPETWAQVRYEYEYTDKPVDEICLDHGVSASTLRDRVRRWRWTPRHEPVPAEGPPPMQRITPPTPQVPAMTPIDVGPFAPAGEMPVAPEIPDGLPAPLAAPSDVAPPDPAGIAPRLQGAVARVLPAIEATIGKLAAGPTHPRETERAARTLTALTRTLRELNELLAQQQPQAAATDDCPEDIDAFRNELARRIHAFVDSQTTDEEWELRGRPPKGFVPCGA
jgi:hypothetical protein